MLKYLAIHIRITEDVLGASSKKLGTLGKKKKGKKKDKTFRFPGTQQLVLANMSQ